MLDTVISVHTLHLTYETGLSWQSRGGDVRKLWHGPQAPSLKPQGRNFVEHFQ